MAVVGWDRTLGLLFSRVLGFWDFLVHLWNRVLVLFYTTLGYCVGLYFAGSFTYIVVSSLGAGCSSSNMDSFTVSPSHFYIFHQSTGVFGRIGLGSAN